MEGKIAFVKTVRLPSEGEIATINAFVGLPELRKRFPMKGRRTDVETRVSRDTKMWMNTKQKT